MQLESVKFHNGGYCWQLARLAGSKSWKPRRFFAVFLSFVHPKYGLCVIDTGYGPRVRAAQRTFNGRLLNFLLPIPRNQPFEQANYLASGHGISTHHVNLVFVSHFHADHIGGLDLFPHSTFVYRHETLEELQAVSGYSQLRHGFLPMLIPSFFESQGCKVGEACFTQHAERLPGLQVYDFFKDGSVLLLDLPGHALGHTGYFLRLQDKSLLYAVDAFWDLEAFQKSARLPAPSRAATFNWPAYCRTQETLRNIQHTLKLNPLGCHCPHTQAYVEQL
ncbi:MAG: MBL fold metallo-hydrolase [Planctomycetales bacterium]|nr:MBL fold metallo-hydrolase [Planctomycetales bacterium]